MTTIWTALVTGGFVIGSVIITSILNGIAESRRRLFELDRHKLDQLHDHKERLLDVRLATYEEFNVCFSAYRRCMKDLGEAWYGRAFWRSKLNDPEEMTTDYITQMIDDATDAYRSILPEAAAKSVAINDVLEKMEHVAAGDVLKEAIDVRSLAEACWDARRHTASAIGKFPIEMESWSGVTNAEEALDNGRSRLKKAIRAELSVETNND